MLEVLTRQNETIQRWRLGNSRLRTQVFNELGISEGDFARNSAFFDIDDYTPSDYLKWVFDELGQASQRPSRFTDGSIPVLYTAAESDTALAEKVHWLPPEGGPSMYVQLVTVDAQATTKDLHLIDPRPACLTGEAATGAYAQCLAITQEAIADQLHGFHTPSARRDGGTCTPILSKTSVLAMTEVQYVRFDFDEAQARWNAVFL
ncbi:RES family NAD+ phosphorylase [Variovorax soli]